MRSPHAPPHHATHPNRRNHRMHQRKYILDSPYVHLSFPISVHNVKGARGLSPSTNDDDTPKKPRDGAHHEGGNHDQSQQLQRTVARLPAGERAAGTAAAVRTGRARRPGLRSRTRQRQVERPRHRGLHLRPARRSPRPDLRHHRAQPDQEERRQGQGPRHRRHRSTSSMCRIRIIHPGAAFVYAHSQADATPCNANSASIRPSSGESPAKCGNQRANNAIIRKGTVGKTARYAADWHAPRKDPS